MTKNEKHGNVSLKKNLNIHFLLLIFFLLMTGSGNLLQAATEPEQAEVLEAETEIAPEAEVFLDFPPLSLLSPSVLEQQLFKHFVAQYTSKGGIAWLNAVIQRGNIYLPHIREEVARRKLPPELVYLPVIESAFQSTARSRSGAVGLWQFMMNSISPFGIKVNDYVDERRDFIKATTGALLKLEENYKALGNWELALAAYNAGLGAVTRAIQRTKINDYWELSRKKHLKSETINYVPKLLAICYIFYQPERYGIEFLPEDFEFMAISLERQISLDVLATEAGVDKGLMHSLNSELLHGISPLDKNYLLKVPMSHLPQVCETLEREDLKLIYYHRHVVRKGDTLYSLSKHYGVTLGMIEQHNSGISNRHLRLGETIIFPAYQEVKPPQYAETKNIRFNGTHSIKKGDTLWSLSIKYDVDPHVLAEANHMQINQILSEGKTLKVPIIE